MRGNDATGRVRAAGPLPIYVRMHAVRRHDHAKVDGSAGRPGLVVIPLRFAMAPETGGLPPKKCDIFRVEVDARSGRGKSQTEQVVAQEMNGPIP